MWMANLACMALLLPIVDGVVNKMEELEKEGKHTQGSNNSH